MSKMLTLNLGMFPSSRIVDRYAFVIIMRDTTASGNGSAV